MDLLFSSLRAEPGRLLALPRRPGAVRGRQTAGSRAQVRALLASLWVAAYSAVLWVRSNSLMRANRLYRPAAPCW